MQPIATLFNQAPPLGPTCLVKRIIRMIGRYKGENRSLWSPPARLRKTNQITQTMTHRIINGWYIAQRRTKVSSPPLIQPSRLHFKGVERNQERRPKMILKAVIFARR